jgi:RimJ/RimL family protein N-acetyltransferase
MDLRTERLWLRPWRADDREPFARLNADACVMEYFAVPPTREESDALALRIETHIEQQGWGLWAVEIPGVSRFAGFIGLSVPRFDAHFTPCTEIGWRMATEFWGRGYATEGARAALAFGFETLGLHEIVSFTTESHMRSRQVMERIGMTRKPSDDFDHPGIAPGHRFRRHVLYRKGVE